MKRLISFYLAWNVIVMLLFGFDKLLAIYKRRRICERALVLFAYFFGSLGAVCGMVLFRHKTAKSKFKLAIFIACLVNAAFIFVFASKILQGN